MGCVGIDLSGSEENPTGVSFLEDGKISVSTLFENDKILRECKEFDPDIVAIDSPLSKSEDGGMREADVEMVKRGFNVFPPDFSGMNKLTERGMKIFDELTKNDFEVIEVHPTTSAMVLMGTKSKTDCEEIIFQKGWLDSKGLNEHEIDSALAALTGFLYLKGSTRELGPSKECIVIPEEGLDFP